MSEPRTRTRLKVLADQNQVRLVPIPPVRGEILDRSGNVLVGNASTLAVVIDRQELGDRANEVLSRLSGLLGVSIPDMQARLTSVKYLPYQQVPVAEGVSDQAVFYIREHQDLFPGVSYQQVPERTYPDGTLAAHLLGYLFQINQQQLDSTAFHGYRPGDLIGQSGVEAAYQQWLRGTPGQRELQVNAQGQVLNPTFREIRPTNGDNVVLSIDANVQKLAEQSLALGISAARHTIDTTTGQYFKAPAGAVIVMEPKTGRVLAMASNPTFDPSLYQNGLTQQEANSLDLNSNLPPVHNQPLFDRALQGQYAPGSTFKPFIAAAAFKDGFATEKGYYPCPATYTAPGDTSGTIFHNWSPLNLGSLSLAQALVISCDTVFYRFGWDYWVRYFHSGKTENLLQADLRSMGFGRPTGIDLPGNSENSGVIPDQTYKNIVYERLKKLGLAQGPNYGWLPGDDINMSIGQGFASVTPMQLAVAYSAIANGGTLMAPRIAWQVRSPDGKLVKTIQPQAVGRLPISARQVAYIRNALTGVPRTGTAATAFLGFPLDQYPVAGKTGTADVAPPKQPTSWFAAMTPANDPQYVVVAMVEQAGHGSETAAPIVRRILEGLFGLGTAKKITIGNIQD